MSGGGDSGESPRLVELRPIAERACDASLSGDVLGRTVTVHYVSALGELTARRFLDGLEAFQRERDEDYAVLRSGLRTHLGEELFSRVEGKRFLRPPELETTWYLLVGAEPPAVIWRHGPDRSRHHFVPESPDGEYTADQLRVRSKLKLEVHEFTHWMIEYLIAGNVVHEVDGVARISSSGHLPRWLEEGICDYTAMQFERWREKRWDSNREIVARLTWDRPAVRAHLLQWVDSTVEPRKALRNPNWIEYINYEGSLGLVFSLETELGSGGLLELFKRLLAEGRQTDEETVALIEGVIGKPLHEIGRVSAETRERFLSALLDRAQVACGREPEPADQIPLATLGHFFDAADRTIPALQALALCPDARIASEGVDGLRLAGRPEPIAQTLAALERSAAPELLSALEADGSLRTARELTRSASQASRWFQSERGGVAESTTSNGQPGRNRSGRPREVRP